MPRRLLVLSLAPGRAALPPDQAHHARDVLRLTVGEEVELFTADGQTANATIIEVNPSTVAVQIDDVTRPRETFGLTIASAIPKGARADWMIEKLSELGTRRWVPLVTDHSVVHPEGTNKIQRWQRLAAESAKQSRRSGVMEIAPLTPLADLLNEMRDTTAYLSTATGTMPLSSILHPPFSSLALLVGPEGGWSAHEMTLFAERHLTPITLGGTILRIETAAIAAAAVVAAIRAGQPPG